MQGRPTIIQTSNTARRPEQVSGQGPNASPHLAISEARRVGVRRVPPLLGLTSLLFSVRGYGQPGRTGPIRRHALRSYQGRRRRHPRAGAALDFATCGEDTVLGHAPAQA